MAVSERTIERLTLYRRVLRELKRGGQSSVRSYEIGAKAGVSAAQVRRDLMVVGYEGSPSRGYEIGALLDSLDEFLVGSENGRAALLGVGNLGRALLSYFWDGRGRLGVSAAFDVAPDKVGRVLNGCRCYHLDELAQVVVEQGISIAILAVPAAEADKCTALALNAGIRGFLNFSPVPLNVPPGVFVENIDLSVALEKVLFFSRPAQRTGA